MKYFETHGFDIYKKGEMAEAFEETISYDFSSPELVVVGMSEHSSELFVSLVFETAKQHSILAVSGCPWLTDEVLKYRKREGADDFKFVDTGAKSDYCDNIQFLNTTDPLAYLWDGFLWDIKIPIIDLLPFRFLRRKYKYIDLLENSETGKIEWIDEEFVLSPNTYLKKLAEIAKAHERQIVVFWPLNKRYNRRKNKQPKLSDFCFSKTVQEYADGIFAVQYKGEADGIELNKSNKQPEFNNIFTLTVLKRLPRIQDEIDEQEELEAEEIIDELKEQTDEELPF